jgi:hypothetical protein
MQLAHHLRTLQTAEQQLAAALRTVADGRADEVDVFHIATTLADQCDEHAHRLEAFVRRYFDALPDAERDEDARPDAPRGRPAHGTHPGPLGLLRDLNDLYLQACECELAWTLTMQAAQGARDRDLLELATRCAGESGIQLKWMRTRMKQAAPQAMVVA